MSKATIAPTRIGFFVMALAFGIFVSAGTKTAAQDSASKESPAVRLLKSGKIPAERLGTVIAIVGRQGTAADFSVLLEKAVDPNGFPKDVRLKAIETLADGAANRKILPNRNRESILTLLPEPGKPGDLPLTRAVVRNIVAWKPEQAAEKLHAIAQADDSPAAIRSECLKGLAQLGGAENLAKLKAMAETETSTRVIALAALASVDPESAAPIAAKIWTGPAPPTGDDVREVLNGFLNRTTGPDALAKALHTVKLSPDTAKLALRQLYAIGRSDAALVSALSEAAGIAGDLAPPTDDEIKKLMDEVAATGNEARGELVFRSEANSCLKCHALRGAGGQVGPELSDVGGVSPVDYLIRSVMAPEAAVKEQYLMMTALTTDGRIVQGIVVDQDDQGVKLKDAEGKEFALTAAEIEEKKIGGSLMPQGLPKLMTHQEFVDLIRFLSELGKPGPYQRTAAATVQRWRVLTSPPSELSTPAPDNQVIQTLSNVPETSWTTQYAFFDGTLPLEPVRKLLEADADMIYLQAEVDVNGRGQTRLALNASEGVTAWLNDQPIKLGDGNPPAQAQVKKAEADRIAAQAKQAPGQFLIPIGRQKITFRIDMKKYRDPNFRAEFAPVEFGQAILTVVGGK